jgi:lipid II:glycine glycyltransferase (peptidoglycan interpeptide bridge formation enzyme)
MEVVRDLEESSWRSFIDGHAHSNIFQTPEMFEVFRLAQGHRPTLWAVKDDDSSVLSLLVPVQITLAKRLHRLTTRAVAYGGVLYDPRPIGKDALALLLRTYSQEIDGKPIFTELRNLSDLAAVQPILSECGFGYADYLNYLISLDHSPDKILQSIGRQTRKHIRRGIRRGEVVVGEARHRDEIALCYDLLLQSYRTAHIPLADFSLFKAAFDVLYPRGMIRFTLARVGQTPIACSVELLWKQTIYGWYSGMNRAYGAYTPNELLMWDILRWGHENDYRLYDFGGAGKTDEEYGVRHFKAKFGGELACFGRNTYVHAPRVLRLSEIGYHVYRRFFLKLKRSS